MKYCLKGIVPVHVNTDVVKILGIIKNFWGVNNWAQSVRWWCLLIKVHNLFECFWKAVTTTVSYLPLRENNIPDWCCSCWNVLLSNCCTNFSELRFPPLFCSGEALCALADFKNLLCLLRYYKVILFVLISCDEYHEFVEWFTGTATPKRCLLLYISSGLLSLSAFILHFLPNGGFVLLYLTGLSYFSLTFFGNKMIWKNSSWRHLFGYLSILLIIKNCAFYIYSPSNWWYNILAFTFQGYSYILLMEGN